jgi:ABC-type nitrate/sulfonate/bicarbonate transport system substrate-binding protein
VRHAPELDEQPALARATVAALVRGYDETLDDPDSAVGTS